MARTDDLERLVSSAELANCKLVLVGDPHQLGAVGPGGLFATLVGDHGATELETVRRFANAWEAEASLRLRARDASVLHEYLERGRIAGGSAERMRTEAFEVWRRARDEGRSVLLMAGDNATVDALSRRCREDRVARGEVERDGARIANGTAGVGDEIVTLKNDRRLRPAPGQFVRNGERWQVVECDRWGGLIVDSLEGRGRVTLPAEYLREHVALGYAVTIHKAQGTTVDEAFVLVDEQMTAQQLYVAMSRGREMNAALVMDSPINPGLDAAYRTRRPAMIETLATVMRHDGAERSAHDVMRENLARMEDLGLLRHLLVEARRNLEKHPGPDRNAEIIALRPRANVQRANRELTEAQSSLAKTEERRTAAERALVEANVRPARALFPGLLGNAARREAEQIWHKAKRALDDARRSEQEALRSYERAGRGVGEAERAAAQLAEARAAQARRDKWFRDGFGSRGWITQLEERVAVCADEIDRAELDEETAKNRGAERGADRARARIREREACPGEAATRAVLDRSRRGDPGYVPAPEPPPIATERGGPVLGR